MKGIILAGGSGTRLYPATQVVSKQLLPVYDKPMVYYPLTTLMLAGIRDMLVISTPQDTPRFAAAARRRPALGHQPVVTPCSPSPKGMAAGIYHRQRSSSARTPCALILGDNIFYGHDLTKRFATGCQGQKSGATIFAYRVQDPGALRRGRVRPEPQGRISIEEKPKQPEIRATRSDRPLLLRQPGGRHRARSSSLPRAASSRSPTSTAST